MQLLNSLYSREIVVIIQTLLICNSCMLKKSPNTAHESDHALHSTGYYYCITSAQKEGPGMLKLNIIYTQLVYNNIVHVDTNISTQCIGACV